MLGEIRSHNDELFFGVFNDMVFKSWKMGVRYHRRMCTINSSNFHMWSTSCRYHKRNKTVIYNWNSNQERYRRVIEFGLQANNESPKIASDIFTSWSFLLFLTNIIWLKIDSIIGNKLIFFGMAN